MSAFQGTHENIAPLKKDGSLNKYSATITEKKSQGAGQAQLHATDVGKIGMKKPQVGISSVWYEGNPCNMHLNDIAGHIKSYVQDLDMVGLRFNSIGVSDGISNGTDGMAYSLQSRDIIADGIETVMGAQFYDANISVPGCDKNMPGCVMAMARVNRPSVMVYGGTIRAGCTAAHPKLDIISAFEAYVLFEHVSRVDFFFKSYNPVFLPIFLPHSPHTSHSLLFTQIRKVFHWTNRG